MQRPWAASAIGLILTGVASGAAWSATEQAMTWESVPTNDQLATRYPTGAETWHTNGKARVRCRVNADGTLSDCAVVFEAPLGFGFGRATLSAAQDFRMKPTTPDGKSVAGRTVVFPMIWRISNVVFTPVFEVGDGALLFTYLNPGEQPTRSSNPVFDCASSQDKGRRCEGHPIIWENHPSNAAVWQLISHAQVGIGETRLSCAAGDDGTLRDCRVGGVATRQEEAAMRELAKDMKPAPVAEDGVSLQRGRITLYFDWNRLMFVSKPPDR